MAESSDPEEHEADFDVELTAEQREKLRKSMDRLSEAIVPTDVKVQNVVVPSFAKLAADMVKLPAFKLPESTLQNITAMSALSDSARSALAQNLTPLLAAQTNAANFLKPILESQAQWQKQFGAINSDVFKTALLGQTGVNSVAAQLAKNADFGLTSSITKYAQQFAAQQSAWLKTLGPTLAGLKVSFYPANLRGIEDLDFLDVEEVVMVDGIALYAVPRKAVAETLVRAEGAAKRRDILGRRWKAISVDCRAALASCDSESVAEYVGTAQAALDALDAGHVQAAQALTGCLLDAIVNTYFGKDRYLYTPDKNGKRTNAAYEEFGTHEYIAFAPVWQAWQKFFPEEGKPVPHTFSRNATAHTVSPKQFNRRNAIQGLMIACGIVVFLDEQATAIARRKREAGS
jgi:hypothetical protein